MRHGLGSSNSPCKAQKCHTRDPLHAYAKLKCVGFTREVAHGQPIAAILNGVASKEDQTVNHSPLVVGRQPGASVGNKPVDTNANSEVTSSGCAATILQQPRGLKMTKKRCRFEDQAMQMVVWRRRDG